MKSRLFVFAALVALMSCGPNTKITKSWRDPSFSIDRSQLNKVLVSAFVKDESSRRVVEDALVARMKGKGVASYTQTFTTTDTANAGAALEAKLKAEGYDGAIILRLAEIEKELNYVPGSYPTYYGRYGGYYGHAYGAYGSPGYYQEDKIYTIEVNVYSLKIDKLVWSGTTATTNPSKLEKTIQEIADVVSDKMIAEGFLKN